MKTESLMALSSVGVMALAMILAYIDKRLFASQMMTHHADIGFPGVANGALWGNMTLMSAALFVIGTYADQWSRSGVISAMFVGLVLSSFAFLVMYRNGLHDDAWAGAGEIHPAGWVAMIYSAGLIAAFDLFYFRSPAEQMDVLIVGGLLALYVPIANHRMLNFFNERWPFVWCPRVFAEESRPMAIMVWGEAIVVAVTAAKLRFPAPWLG